MVVATVGFAIGLDAELFRTLGAILLIAVGVVLLVPALQARLSVAAAPFGAWADARFDGNRSGLAGQFGVGVLLGAVWSPCVGPTLGAASVLASQGRDLFQVSLTMLVFAIGTAIPLLALGFMSREAMIRWRGRMLQGGRGGRIVLGLVLIGTALLILTGADKAVQAVLLSAMPSWLSDIATRY